MSNLPPDEWLQKRYHKGTKEVIEDYIQWQKNPSPETIDANAFEDAIKDLPLAERLRIRGKLRK